jgi:hypothetical protein
MHLRQQYNDDSYRIANLFRTDALSWFIDETLTEQIQSVGAGGGEEVTQRCFGELANGYIVGQFCMPLQAVINVARVISTDDLQAILPRSVFQEHGKLSLIGPYRILQADMACAA